jgi:hypothetical protein
MAEPEKQGSNAMLKLLRKVYDARMRKQENEYTKRTSSLLVGHHHCLCWIVELRNHARDHRS